MTTKTITDNRPSLGIGQVCFYLSIQKHLITVHECIVMKITPKKMKVIVRIKNGLDVEFKSEKTEFSSTILYSNYKNSQNSKLIPSNNPDKLQSAIDLHSEYIKSEIEKQRHSIAKKMIQAEFYDLKYGGIFNYSLDELKALEADLAKRIAIRDVCVQFENLEK